MALTPKQEKFCQGVVNGLNFSEAYREAYNTENMQVCTLRNKACNLMKKDAIKARIEELKEKVEEKLVYTAIESFKNLVKAQELALNRICGRGKDEKIIPDLRSYLTAEELKGKLARLYVEQRETAIVDKPFIIEVKR